MAYNKEVQKRLDKNKWIMSEECGEDLSGEMLYCEYCYPKQGLSKCPFDQQEREEKCYCATAYNRMRRCNKK